MEVKGIAGGVTVIDDFGHHPTAIRETLRALRIKYAKDKIWAIFEPRTNTTRRNYFRRNWPSPLWMRTRWWSPVARLELLAPEERLNPQKLMQDIGATGKLTAYLPDADAIVAHLAQNVQAATWWWCSATAGLAASTQAPRATQPPIAGNLRWTLRLQPDKTFRRFKFQLKSTL